MECTEALLEKDFSGLCFVNLVDFDSMYGHRQDTRGYAAALTEFDSWLGVFLSKMRESDLLMITADHGCDPGDDSTDHTRECVTLIVYGKDAKGKNLGTFKSFGHIAATASEIFGIKFKAEEGTSLWNIIKQ